MTKKKFIAQYLGKKCVARPAFGSERSSFEFLMVERTYSPNNYSVNNGVCSVWPFDFSFIIAEKDGYPSALLMENDNCNSAYTIDIIE